MARLGAGYSARSGPELRAGLRKPPLAAMPVEYLTLTIEDRAVEVLTLLADRGQHRAPSIPDLIIAATAEALLPKRGGMATDFLLVAGWRCWFELILPQGFLDALGAGASDALVTTERLA